MGIFWGCLFRETTLLGSERLQILSPHGWLLEGMSIQYEVWSGSSITLWHSNTKIGLLFLKEKANTHQPKEIPTTFWWCNPNLTRPQVSEFCRVYFLDFNELRLKGNHRKSIPFHEIFFRLEGRTFFVRYVSVLLDCVPKDVCNL